MDEPGRHYAEWSKPKDEHYMIISDGKSSLIHRQKVYDDGWRMMVARTGEGGVVESRWLVLNGYIQMGKMRKFWKCLVVMVAQQREWT